MPMLFSDLVRVELPGMTEESGFGNKGSFAGDESGPGERQIEGVS